MFSTLSVLLVTLVIDLARSVRAAHDYVTRFWAVHAHEPIPVTILRNHTEYSPLIGQCRPSSAWSAPVTQLHTGEDVLVMMWDPLRFVVPAHMARTLEHAQKHMLYFTRCVLMMDAVDLSPVT